MKFLVDNQLPPALARHLETQGASCQHIGEVELDQATDREIWNHAAANGYTVISKDEDFLHLSIADPHGPPLIWVRLGNCRTPALLAAFDQCWPSVLMELNSGSKIIEVR